MKTANTPANIKMFVTLFNKNIKQIQTIIDPKIWNKIFLHSEYKNNLIVEFLANEVGQFIFDRYGIYDSHNQNERYFNDLTDKKKKQINHWLHHIVHLSSDYLLAIKETSDEKFCLEDHVFCQLIAQQEGIIKNKRKIINLNRLNRDVKNLSEKLNIKIENINSSEYLKNKYHDLVKKIIELLIGQPFPERPIRIELIESKIYPAMRLGNWIIEKPRVDLIDDLVIKKECIRNALNIEYEKIEDFIDDRNFSQLFLNKIMYYYFGRKFSQSFMKMQYKHWVAPHETLIKRHCGRPSYPRKFDDNLIYLFHKNKNLIFECLEDGNEHLVPWVLLFSKDPKTLKKTFGKSIWKKIANNSVSRNILIRNALYVRIRLKEKGKKNFQYATFINYFKRMTKNRIAAIHSHLQRMIDIPSNYIKNMKNLHTDNEAFYYCAAIAKHEKMLTSKEKLKLLHNIFKDTRTMAGNLNQVFNPNWSLKRLQKEHKRLSELLLTLNYSNEPYYFSHQWIAEMEENGIKAVLLKTPLALAKEAKAMHHCVASYHELIMDNEYLVYSIHKDGFPSTLGISIDKSGVSLDQHYGLYNQILEESEYEEAFSILINKLNNIFWKNDQRTY